MSVVVRLLWKNPECVPRLDKRRLLLFRSIEHQNSQGDPCMNPRDILRLAFSAVLFATAFGLLCSRAAAVSLSEPATGTTVSVGQDGAYSVSIDSPSWTFGGTVGHTISNLQTGAGSDNLGAYQQVSLAYFDGASRV